MMKNMRQLITFTAMLGCAALAHTVLAQDGLAGELDDLLGIGGGAQAPAAVQQQADEAVADVAEALDAAVAEAAEEVEAEVAEVIEEAVLEAQPVLDVAAADIVEDQAAPVMDEAEENVVAEAVAIVDDAGVPADDAEALVDDAAAVKEQVAEAAADPEVASPTAAEDRMLSEVATLEQMRRKALEAHGRSSLEAARSALRKGNYAEAQKLYEEAAKFITKRDDNRALIDEADRGASEAIYRQATVLWKKGDRERAAQLARQAREQGHPKAPKLVATLQDEIENPPAPPTPKVAKRWAEDAYQNNRDLVQRRLIRARELYITGEYNLARDELELILKDNPYDREALNFLRRVQERVYDVAANEFETTRTRMIGDVRSTWTPRRYAIDISADEIGAGGDPRAGVAVVDPSGKTIEELTLAKMKSITIPEINFRAANINDVIGFFEQASREFDSQEIPPEQRGVNFILQLPAQDDGAQIEDDPFAPAARTGRGGVPPITFTARYMDLYEALRIITDVASLKFRIRSNAVMIMPLNMPERDMVTRSYTVLPSIGDRATSVVRELDSQPGAGAGGFLAPVEDTMDSGQVDWKKLFADMGVRWPDGSSISYIPSINKMRVYNTPENLADVEIALQDLNVTPRQIEIEARFVEVSQRDLESLGFEWLLTDDWEIANKRGNPQQRMKINAGSGTRGGLRYTGDEQTANYPKLDALPVADNIISAASVLTNPELSFVLHMLSQRANTDLLSAPKVVTKNSQDAVIKVVTEYIYPTEYTITENQRGGGGLNNNVVQENIPMVEPGGFEMREVGVILQVLPEVSADGQMIDLTLNPQIISEPSWRDYGFDYFSSQSPDPVHVKMEQPFFPVRSINTSISIYNGATVVMGGMITEERTEVNDKVPFLGDIPILGRLFRSRYEHSEKRNLLIFVTARLVDPAGRSLKGSGEQDGSHTDELSAVLPVP